MKELIAAAEYVIAAPGIDLDRLRAAVKPGARVYGYLESIMCPTKKEGVPAFYLELQEAMHFYGNYEAFWCDSFNQPLNFGTDAWPQARIKPKNKYADWLVDFCVGSPVLRAFDGIYLDDFTKEVPKYVYQELPINWQDPVTLANLQKDHAHYINRLASGLRARMDPGFKLIANTATFTHPALDAITVECACPEKPTATPRDEALKALKNQDQHGMAREVGTVWYVQGAANAYEGKWPS